MKIPVNKILAVGMVLGGAITDDYVQRKMWENEKNKKSIIAAISRLGVGTTIKVVHYHLAMELAKKDKLEIDIPFPFGRTPGEKLLDKVNEIIIQHDNGNISFKEARDKIYKLMVKYPDLSIGERAFLIELIQTDEEIFKSADDDTFYYAMVIGESLEELPTGEEIESVYEKLMKFIDRADDIYDLLEEDNWNPVLKKNCAMKFEELLHRKYHTIEGLQGIINELDKLYDSYVG